ncbi:trihelix transcription factor GTL2-like [Aristolochia californica]|uniref:trihelix transcription factor GTL2-like n=1 Tax=Aristolochia californica TaxID=171875 RepID=UPI0035D73C7B
MFNGVGEQIQQFIAASTTAIPLHLPLSLPLHVSPTIFPGFNSAVIYSPPQPVLRSHLLQGLQVQDNDSQEEKQEEEESSRSIDLERDRSVSDPKGRWLEEESLGVMRVRSGMESGFPDSVLSRKLAEAGFNRMAENYQETIEGGMSKYSEKLDGGKEAVATKEGQTKLGGLDLEEYSDDETPENASMQISNPAAAKETRTKKRKRSQNLEKMKVVCEEIVQKLITQQEELHTKLLEDMEKREVERVAREGALRMQEIARLDSEIEIRAQEQALACTRDATIIGFLKKFTSTRHQNQDDQSARTNSVAATQNSTKTPTSSSTSPPQNANSAPHLPSPTRPANTATSNSCKNQTTPSPPGQSTNTSSAPRITTSMNEMGRRWPKAEVYSLISVRCSLFKSSEDKTSKLSLWERISQKMTELGYNRSAKRCKEKWENINKYFKKTKDVTKKRSRDSKTCPYFHELSRLYNQGVVLLHQEKPETISRSPENQTDSSQGGYHEDTVHAGENDSNTMFRVEF